MYTAQHAELSDMARVISYDRRGFGLTTTPDEPFAQIDDLEKVVEACRIDAAVLIGCSQGGRIAIDFALRHPDFVTGLFLVAPVVSGMPQPDLPPDLKKLDDAIDLAYEVEDLERINELEVKAWLDGPRSETGRTGRAARELFTEMNGKALEHSELTLERKPDSAWDRVQEITAPVRLYCGDLDFPYMQDLARGLADRLPNSDFRSLSGMAHLPFLESPETMNAELRDFLSSL
ncbi:pimeloyl-ACP methyl ester carboxylesterase [Aliiruegeria haliotis]|uniref:Pimeloyl-ACP methyl ester carboxylesterase n=2 Tax=Aliiruegeria haliotis TaxID=1280846 RepID=A0A2T0S0I9_9RHOB|nr:pimeloyl-ACP methyl ester carboxylesterase [Aliiruegeria haliotis]